MEAKEDIGKALALLTPIAIVSSLGYLIAYWTLFDVDIIDYISPSDVIIYSAIPLLASLAVFPIMLAAVAITSIVPGIGTIIGILVIAAIFIAFDIDAMNLWLILPVILAGSTTAVLISSEIRILGIKKDAIRAVVLFSLIYFPSESIVVGYLKAYFVKTGNNYSHLEFIGVNKRGDLSLYEKYRYLGKVGEYTFFLVPDEDLVITEKHDNLVPFKKHLFTKVDD